MVPEANCLLKKPPDADAGRRVLILTGDTQLSGLIGTVLDARGIGVVLANHVDEDLSRSWNRHSTPYAGILDVPFGNGALQVRDMIATLRASVPNICVLLMQGPLRDEIRRIQLEDSKLWLLPKPFRLEDLTRVVHEMLR